MRGVHSQIGMEDDGALQRTSNHDDNMQEFVWSIFTCTNDPKKRHPENPSQMANIGQATASSGGPRRAERNVFDILQTSLALAHWDFKMTWTNIYILIGPFSLGNTCLFQNICLFEKPVAPLSPNGPFSPHSSKARRRLPLFGPAGRPVAKNGQALVLRDRNFIFHMAIKNIQEPQPAKQFCPFEETHLKHSPSAPRHPPGHLTKPLGLHPRFTAKERSSAAASCGRKGCTSVFALAQSRPAHKHLVLW